MALGKPVLCFIRDDFESRLSNCPIVRCTREDLVERLSETLSETTDRATVGERGRAYAEREHASAGIAARLLALYRSLGARA
jgi:hypothetical protein